MMTRGFVPLPEVLPVPDTDPIYSTAADLRTFGRALCKVTNDTDKAIAITPEFTTADDPDFDAAVEGTSQNIATGKTDFFTLNDPWALARVKIVAADVPSPGGEVALVWNYMHGRD